MRSLSTMGYLIETFFESFQKELMNRKVVEPTGQRFDDKLPGNRPMAEDQPPLLENLVGKDRARLIKNLDVDLLAEFPSKTVPDFSLNFKASLRRGPRFQKNGNIDIARIPIRMFDR